MTYRNSSPPISSFSPSYPVQEFRCADENQYNHHQYYATPSYAPEFHQEHPQPSAQSTPLEEHLSWAAEFKKEQQELLDQLNSRLMQLNEKFSQSSTPEPVHHPEESVSMELIDPPEVQSPKEVFEDTEKLSNIVSSQVELEIELSAPEMSLDTCEVPLSS